MSTTEEIIRDPLFQLNALIWMLQDIPGPLKVRPVLRDLGYSLFGIGQALTPPPQLRERLLNWVGNVKPPVPEAIASHKDSDQDWLIFECKASSFGVASSTASQMRKYIAIAPWLHRAVGLGGKHEPQGQVVYISADGHGTATFETLKLIRKEARRAEVKPGHAAVIELIATQRGVSVRCTDSTRRTSPLQSLVRQTRFLELDESGDPRPLYYIPWDPTVDQQTDSAKQARETFIQRCLIYAISEIRRADVGSTVVIDGTSLINSVTNNLAKLWRDREALRTMSKSVMTVIAERFSREKKKRLTFANSGFSISLTIPSPEIRQLAADILLRGEVEEEEDRDPMIDRQASLFDRTV